MIEHRNIKKVKFAIQTEGSDRTYIAGLYRYEDHDGMQIPMFSILTREAAGSVRDIHDRMPLILDKDNVLNWIRPNGYSNVVVEKALSNMIFEKAVEYHRSQNEFIIM